MFKAAVLVEQNKPLEIVHLPSSKPKKGQVRVKMISAGLCGAQLNEISGVKGADKFLPHLMGHEGFGVVLDIGEGVSRVKTNDYVVLHWRKGFGQDVFGGTYTHKILGQVGSGPVTTFAEETIVSENRATAISHNTEFWHLYPLLGCAITTAYGIVEKETMPSVEENVLIVGAGGLGVSIGLMLKAKGFEKLTFIEKTPEKLNGIFSEGAKVYHDFLELDNKLFKYIYDTTGIPSILSNCFDFLDANGQLVLVGQPRVNSELKIKNPLRFFNGIKIFASDGGGFDPDFDLIKVKEIIESNKKSFNSMISNKISLDEVNDGFDLMRSGLANRIIIEF